MVKQEKKSEPKMAVPPPPPAQIAETVAKIEEKAAEVKEMAQESSKEEDKTVEPKKEITDPKADNMKYFFMITYIYRSKISTTEMEIKAVEERIRKLTLEVGSYKARSYPVPVAGSSLKGQQTSSSVYGSHYPVVQHK